MRATAAPPDAPRPGSPALHRAMFAVDIVSFSSRRDPAVQKHLRHRIHQIAAEACHTAGIGWDDCHTEDRGDGLYAIAGPDAPIEDLLGPLVWQIHAGVRDHNKMANRAARLQLRIAVHAGYVHFDEHGATGLPLIHLFRLLDAPAFKTLLAESGGEVALIVSHYLHEEVIAYSPGTIDAGAYQPIDVQVKETRDRAWVWLPPVRPHPLPRSHSGPQRPDVSGITTALLAVMEQITDAAPDVRLAGNAPDPPAVRGGTRLVPTRVDDPEERLAEMMALAEGLLAGRSDRTEGHRRELAVLLFILERLTALLEGDGPPPE
jgi:hypothetical protein